MEANPIQHPELQHIPNRTPEQIHQYQLELTKAFDWAHKHKGAQQFFTNEPVSDIIITSYLLSDHHRWINQFRDAWNEAAFNWRTPGQFWISIARRLSTPEVQNHWVRLHPDLDRAKYFDTPLPGTTTPSPAPRPRLRLVKKPRHRRAELWRLHAKWEHLQPSSRQIYLEMVRRAQFSKRLHACPWTQTGIQSLVKFTRVSKRQVIRALNQLERYKLIKRIYRGNSFIGASKYLVFVTPKMSGLYSFLSAGRHKQLPR